MRPRPALCRPRGAGGGGLLLLRRPAASYPSLGSKPGQHATHSTQYAIHIFTTFSQLGGRLRVQVHNAHHCHRLRPCLRPLPRLLVCSDVVPGFCMVNPGLRMHGALANLTTAQLTNTACLQVPCPAVAQHCVYPVRRSGRYVQAVSFAEQPKTPTAPGQLMLDSARAWGWGEEKCNRNAAPGTRCGVSPVATAISSERSIAERRPRTKNSGCLRSLSAQPVQPPDRSRITDFDRFAITDHVTSQLLQPLAGQEAQHARQHALEGRGRRVEVLEELGAGGSRGGCRVPWG